MKKLINKLRMNPRLQVMLIGSVVLVNAIVMTIYNFTADDPGKRQIERCINGKWMKLENGKYRPIKDKSNHDKKCS